MIPECLTLTLLLFVSVWWRGAVQHQREDASLSAAQTALPQIHLWGDLPPQDLQKVLFQRLPNMHDFLFWNMKDVLICVFVRMNTMEVNGVQRCLGSCHLLCHAEEEKAILHYFWVNYPFRNSFLLVVLYIYISAVKLLIAINRIQNVSFFCIIYVCCVYLLCIYKHMHSVYIWKICTCLYLYYKYIFNIETTYILKYIHACVFIYTW